MSHVMVIGGTGMLADTCIGLALQGYSVSIIGRDALRHSMLMKKAGTAGARLHPVIADYTNELLLRKGIEEAVDKLEQPAAIIAWIHSHAVYAHAIAAEYIGNAECHYFHIRGRTDFRALAIKNPVQQQLESIRNVRYHQVILGFKKEGRSSRWLTDEEISRGVLDAFNAAEQTFIVGLLEPFEERPGQ